MSFEYLKLYENEMAGFISELGKELKHGEIILSLYDTDVTALNVLGGDGWELLSVVVSVRTTEREFYFKRVISDSWKLLMTNYAQCVVKVRQQNNQVRQDKYKVDKRDTFSGVMA